MTGEWTADWIGPSHDVRKNFGVFLFRRRFNLEHVHQRLEVRVSADQRYKLYANGKFVGFGPQRGDLQHWFYDDYDIAPFLKSGDNTIHAVVWNFGAMAPMAQISSRTGFLLDDFEFETLSTPREWEVAPVPAWDFGWYHQTVGPYYIDIGPGEMVHADQIAVRHLIEAELEYGQPVKICLATDRGADGGGTPWMLLPRSIPLMDYLPRLEPAAVRRGFNGDNTPEKAETSLESGSGIFLGPGETLLLDYQELLCAYPRLVVSGAGKLTLTYAESLWQNHSHKGNRNDVRGKTMRGYEDVIVLGQEPFEFEPLWWRTYRFLLLEADGQAQINRIDAIETGYPYQVESSFEADDERVKGIWEVAVRTAQRCAGETYFDCPYYEQLQYAGDTRLQVLIHYYLSGDRALARNAVENLHWSLIETGLTQSRYPSRQAQIIPSFSLWYLAMLADQQMYDRVEPISMEQDSRADRIDTAFTELLIHPDHSFWNFADWVPSWPAGVPPGGVRAMVHRLTQFYAKLLNLPVDSEIYEDGTSASLHFAEDLEFARGEFEQAFSKIDGLVREQGERPSEHAEAMYRLCQMELCLPPDPWPFSALERDNAPKCTYQFSYYKFMAMQPEDYLGLLEPWVEMIEDGHTTFAENPEPTRSDCHAWSAHPILGFFQIVAGVTSVAYGWQKCKIQPRPGRLRKFDARIAHPDGQLSVKFDSGKLKIDSPVPYELVWQGRVLNVAEGTTSF